MEIVFKKGQMPCKALDIQSFINFAFNYIEEYKKYKTPYCVNVVPWNGTWKVKHIFKDVECIVYLNQDDLSYNTDNCNRKDLMKQREAVREFREVILELTDIFNSKGKPRRSRLTQRDMEIGLQALLPDVPVKEVKIGSTYDVFEVYFKAGNLYYVRYENEEIICVDLHYNTVSCPENIKNAIIDYLMEFYKWKS